MSRKPRSLNRAKQWKQAEVFAALGDPTRLALVAKLSSGGAQSISALAAGSRLSRQAISKHLRNLEKARIVHSRRIGRQNLFAFQPETVEQTCEYLNRIAAQWDDALMRLKAFVETS